MEDVMHASNNNERRKHRLFVTQNTEYHLREETCVGVRDLWSGRWREDHPAVGRRLSNWKVALINWILSAI